MPVYTEQELRRRLKKGEYASFYLLTGSEDYLRDGYEKQIAERLFPAGEDPFNLRRFDMDKTDPDEAVEAMVTLPLMADRKLVILHGLRPEKLGEGQYRLLFDTLSDLPPTTVVICSIPDTGKRGKKTASLCRLAEKTGALLELQPRSRNELHRMLQKKAETAGVLMDGAACDALLNGRGAALLELQPEMEKLIAAAGEGGRITAELVDTLVTPDISASSFDIAKKLLAGKTDAALHILTDLLSEKTYRDKPELLFGAVSASFLDLYRAKCGLNDGVRFEELAPAFGYKGREFALRRAYGQAARYEIDSLRRILSLLSDADIRLKSGGDKTVILQRLLVEIAAAISAR